MIPVLVAAFVGLVSPASAATLIGTFDGNRCLTVVAGQVYRGGPVYVGTCNAYEANWNMGPNLLGTAVANGLCVEAPPGGGYVFLETCGRNAYQSLNFVRSTGIIAVANDRDKALTVGSNSRVYSANITGGPAQIWRW